MSEIVFAALYVLLYLHRVLARSGLSLKDKLPGEDVTLGEALMAPTVIYVKQVTFYDPPFLIIMPNVFLSPTLTKFSFSVPSKSGA